MSADSSETPQAQQAMDSTSSGDEIQLAVHHHGSTHTYTFAPSATLNDLAQRIEETLSIPPSGQKYLITPKTGLVRPSTHGDTLSLSSIISKKIVLMGSTPAEVHALDSTLSAASASATRRSPIKAATPAKTRDWKRAKEDAEYTFHTLRPLPYLPRPERSLRFLERLRDDPGIRAAMRGHKFSVPLLTEMDPAAHTTHESRTLGLNRNRGEVIELRLRTDAYDGYRDYRTIRKTLCHELAHNVWGEHDRNFWELCKEIEREVERGDWTRGGHRVGEEEFYNPEDRGEDVHMDHGGWTGGEFVLGSAGGGGETVVGTVSGEVPAGSLTRREILARAAEERIKRSRQVGGAGDRSGSESSKSHE